MTRIWLELLKKWVVTSDVPHAIRAQCWRNTVQSKLIDISEEYRYYVPFSQFYHKKFRFLRCVRFVVNLIAYSMETPTKNINIFRYNVFRVKFIYRWRKLFILPAVQSTVRPCLSDKQYLRAEKSLISYVNSISERLLRCRSFWQRFAKQNSI